MATACSLPPGGAAAAGPAAEAGPRGGEAGTTLRAADAQPHGGATAPEPGSGGRPPGGEAGATLRAADAGPIVFFDGVCSLCNATVNFLLDRDREGKLRFAPLQSKTARETLGALGHRLGDVPESLVMVEDGNVYEQSTAVLRIAKHLSRRRWRLATALLVVPRPLRDAAYRWIAKNRYAWFGRAEACRVPSPELRSRFLE